MRCSRIPADSLHGIGQIFFFASDLYPAPVNHVLPLDRIRNNKSRVIDLEHFSLCRDLCEICVRVCVISVGMKKKSHRKFTLSSVRHMASNRHKIVIIIKKHILKSVLRELQFDSISRVQSTFFYLSPIFLSLSLSLPLSLNRLLALNRVWPLIAFGRFPW